MKGSLRWAPSTGSWVRSQVSTPPILGQSVGEELELRAQGTKRNSLKEVRKCVHHWAAGSALGGMVTGVIQQLVPVVMKSKL